MFAQSKADVFNPIQGMGGGGAGGKKTSPTSFFPCNFYKRST